MLLQRTPAQTVTPTHPLNQQTMVQRVLVMLLPRLSSRKQTPTPPYIPQPLCQRDFLEEGKDRTQSASPIIIDHEGTLMVCKQRGYMSLVLIRSGPQRTARGTSMQCE